MSSSPHPNAGAPEDDYERDRHAKLKTWDAIHAYLEVAHESGLTNIDQKMYDFLVERLPGIFIGQLIFDVQEEVFHQQEAYMLPSTPTPSRRAPTTARRRPFITLQEMLATAPERTPFEQSLNRNTPPARRKPKETSNG